MKDSWLQSESFVKRAFAVLGHFYGAIGILLVGFLGVSFVFAIIAAFVQALIK